MAASIISTEIPKKVFDGMTRSRKAPRKHPAVRKMKYSPVAKPASSRGSDRRSIIIFGAAVLVPTSMPTWHMMPMKQSRMKGRPSSFMHSLIPDALSGRSSSIGVAPSTAIDSTLTAA